MKKHISLGFTALLAMFSAGSFAEQSATQPPTPVLQQAEQKVEVKTVNVNQVNINAATAAEIQDKLVGIGAKKAQAIVEYREKHGKFISIEQLTEVSGIGKATLDKNRDRIVLE